MGMESYYIKLDVEDLKFSDSIKECFKQRYSVSEYKMSSGKLFKKSIVDDRRFVIDGKAIVTITKMQNTTEITFELCFSNYEDNLLYIYNVAQWISSLGRETKLIVLNSEFIFNALDYEKFKKIISKSFNVKMQQFNARYGKIKVDILPHDFYIWIRRRRILGMLIKRKK